MHVAAGGGHTVALLRDGRLRTFGFNTVGQCRVPADIQGQCVAVAAGEFHTVALLRNCSLRAFGSNTSGQCHVPADIQGQCVAVAAGRIHTVALLQNGNLRAFGSNRSGRCQVPADIQGQCVAVAAGSNHTVALLRNGNLSAFGNNDAGQCQVPADIQGQCVAVAAGDYHTVALLRIGNLRAFGSNGSGKCQVPADIQGRCAAVAAGLDHTVALLKNGNLRAFGDDDSGQCQVPADIQGQCVAVAAGCDHTVALLKTGSLRAFGRNNFGQCRVPEELQTPGALEVEFGQVYLTAHCKAEGPDTLHLTFTSIGGEVRAEITEGRSALFNILLMQLHSQLEHPGQRLELVHEDGRQLKDPTGTATLDEIFGVSSTTASVPSFPLQEALNKAEEHQHAEKQDLSAQAQASVAQQLAGVGASEAAFLSNSAAAAEEPRIQEVDESGLAAADIDLVISQAGCSRQKALRALKANNNDTVEAIMAISSGRGVQ